MPMMLCRAMTGWTGSSGQLQSITTGRCFWHSAPNPKPLFYFDRPLFKVKPVPPKECHYVSLQTNSEAGAVCSKTARLLYRINFSKSGSMVIEAHASHFFLARSEIEYHFEFFFVLNLNVCNQFGGSAKEWIMSDLNCGFQATAPRKLFSKGDCFPPEIKDLGLLTQINQLLHTKRLKTR